MQVKANVRPFCDDLMVRPQGEDLTRTVTVYVTFVVLLLGISDHDDDNERRVVYSMRNCNCFLF